MIFLARSANFARLLCIPVSRPQRRRDGPYQTYTLWTAAVHCALSNGPTLSRPTCPAPRGPHQESRRCPTIRSRSPSRASRPPAPSAAVPRAPHRSSYPRRPLHWHPPSSALPSPSGCLAETDRLDLLDGIIVALARGARKAARDAARRLGQPSLTANFELDKIYKRGAAPAKIAAPATPPAPATPAGTP